MNARGAWIAVAVLGAAMMSCAHQPAPTTRPSIATTRPSYWIDQPEGEHISSGNFDELWKSCELAARHYGFAIDRQDYRGGVLTTVPLISKQFFELWHNDVQTAHDLADSSIAEYRRTLIFVFQKEPDGRFTVKPTVVIERHARSEHPISASVYLRDAFHNAQGTRPVGTPEADWGILLPIDYWYATGRDWVLEKDVAKRVESQLKNS